MQDEGEQVSLKDLMTDIAKKKEQSPIKKHATIANSNINH